LIELTLKTWAGTMRGFKSVPKVLAHPDHAFPPPDPLAKLEGETNSPRSCAGRSKADRMRRDFRRAGPRWGRMSRRKNEARPNLLARWTDLWMEEATTSGNSMR
jgi:hypothetical protein